MQRNPILQAGQPQRHPKDVIILRFFVYPFMPVGDTLVVDRGSK